jgi:hypothetical protein
MDADGAEPGICNALFTPPGGLGEQYARETGAAEDPDERTLNWNSG